MKNVPLFLAATILGGVGGFVGSVVGGALGKGALFAGGFIGGILIAPVTAWVARSRHWIDASRFWPVAIGAAAGFVVAATIAVNTLSSPVGPAIATIFTGLGAVAGARLRTG